MAGLGVWVPSLVLVKLIVAPESFSLHSESVNHLLLLFPVWEREGVRTWDCMNGTRGFRNSLRMKFNPCGVWGLVWDKMADCWGRGDGTSPALGRIVLEAQHIVHHIVKWAHMRQSSCSGKFRLLSPGISSGGKRRGNCTLLRNFAGSFFLAEIWWSSPSSVTSCVLGCSSAHHDFPEGLLEILEMFASTCLDDLMLTGGLKISEKTSSYWNPTTPH